MANASEEKDLHEVLKSLLDFTTLWREDKQDPAKHYYYFRLYVQFSCTTWYLQCLKMQLLNHSTCLQELDCTGEHLNPIIMASQCL